MLTQEDFAASTMSAGANLQRSSWKAEAIRRGDLKISGPFPITEETPLSIEEEKEYTEKLQAGLQTASPDTTVSQPPPPPAPPSLPQDTESGATQKAEVPSKEPENVHNLRHKTSLDGLRETSEMQSTQPLPSDDRPSPLSTIPRSSTMATGTKKRKGSIRNVFRKMFGRRSREKTLVEEDHIFKHGHHRSVSIAQPCAS
jgi:hypothetical protein